MSVPGVTVAIPIHNEEETIPALLRRVGAVLDTLPGGPHELLVVNDGSRDRSLELLELAAHDPRLTVVTLSRNFGHQAALTAAFDYARGDAVVLMDGDLQDPPEVIPALLAKLHEGFDVVYARRTRRKEPLWLRTAYWLAYRIIQKASNIALPLDSGDFAILSRRVVNAVRDLPERQRYLRGLRSWVGFKQTGFDVERAARVSGESKYSMTRLVGLALDGIFAFSTTPLRLIGVAGGTTLLFSVLFSAYAVYVRIVDGHSPAGFTALAVLLTMIGGVVLLSLWVIGEYIGRIYEEVKRRPVYVVERVLGRRREDAD